MPFPKELLSYKIASDPQNKNSKFRFLEYSELHVQTTFIVDQDDLTHQSAVQTSYCPRPLGNNVQDIVVRNKRSASMAHRVATLAGGCMGRSGLAGILQIITRRIENNPETEALKNGFISDTKP